MEENTVMVNGLEMSGSIVKEIDKRLKKVDSKIAAISKGYLSICGDVAYFRDTKAHLVTGHKNLYDLCAERFGMARGTVSNLTQIYDKWGADYKLPEDVSKRKITELLAEIKDAKQLEDHNGDNGGEDHDGNNGGEEPDAGDHEEDSDNDGALSPHAAYSFEVNSDDWTVSEILEEILKHFRAGVVQGFPEQIQPGDKITLTIN